VPSCLKERSHPKEAEGIEKGRLLLRQKSSSSFGVLFFVGCLKKKHPSTTRLFSSLRRKICVFLFARLRPRYPALKNSFCGLPQKLFFAGGASGVLVH